MRRRSAPGSPGQGQGDLGGFSVSQIFLCQTGGGDSPKVAQKQEDQGHFEQGKPLLGANQPRGTFYLSFLWF